MKTILYVDGFNLYYSALRGTPHRWLNPVALAARAFPKNQIIATKFFSAKVTPLPGDPQQPVRQQIYWRALGTVPDLSIIEGDFRTRKTRAKVVTPPPNTIEIYKTEEKGKGLKANKHIYDYVFTDSGGERTFVGELDASTEVIVYAKLPKAFSIPTPVGNYSPDWAIAFEANKVKHIYFIAETKGSMSSLQLKDIEKSKIACAKKFFAKITNDQVKYEMIDSYGKLMDLVK